jgi:hypothetical protein
MAKLPLNLSKKAGMWFLHPFKTNAALRDLRNALDMATASAIGNLPREIANLIRNNLSK